MMQVEAEGRDGSIMTSENSAIPSPWSRPVSPAASPNVRPLPIKWFGPTWRLAGLGVFNLLMTILTLGVYSFWGRTEVRRRIWSAIRIDGQPLAYTGTGAEMCKGFFLVAVLILLPMLLLGLGAALVFGEGGAGVVQVLLYLVVFIFVALGTYRARRYRLSRTAWRGIRGSMAGTPRRYAFMSVITTLLYPLTAGWIAPWRANYLQSILTNETELGDRRLTYEGKIGGLYGRYAVLWFGSVVLLAGLSAAILGIVGLSGIQPGQPLNIQLRAQESLKILGLLFGGLILWSIISAWYRASLYNHFARSTKLDGVPFKLSAGAGGLMWLLVSNYMISYFTLGALRPVAEARSWNYFIDHLILDGPIDAAAIGQNTRVSNEMGEGLATAFDVDAF
jgi:uncharacterized membrane protein YjgN (DUF898 family)